MLDVVINVDRLGKRYLLGGAEVGYRTFREAVIAGMAAPFRKLRRLQGFREPDEMFWALKDISFEVGRGEVVGVIGRNGAGKSTLLKILSRITAPTSGRVEMKGRVGSLLEVGTGFHPELTARENIYLNGTILGMTRGQIKKKFSQIVEFAEIETFLDTPVKRYSSGMYVRLAFSVAAHLEPDIMLVDEVLSVGDYAFQRKCLGALDHAARSGRTVLFVSHNLAAVSQLCSRAIWLHDGVIRDSGACERVTGEYMKFSTSPTEASHLKSVSRNKPHSKAVQIQKVSALGGGSSGLIRTGESLVIRIDCCILGKLRSPAFGVSIGDIRGFEIVRFSTQPISGYEINEVEGNTVVELTIPRLPLTAGLYKVTIFVAQPNVEYLVWMENVLTIEVVENDFYKSGFAVSNRFGVTVMEHSWQLIRQGDKR